MRVGLCAVLIGLMLVSVSLLGCRVRGSSRDRPDRDGKVSWRSSGSERKPPEKLPRGARTLFERNGFVVLGRQESRSIKDGYFTVLGRNFITSDAVLYVFHCLFRGGLSRYEKDRLTPLLEGLTGKCLAHAREERDRLRADPLLSEPARRNVVLFAVASELLTGQAVPDERSDVAALVTDILAADKPGYYPAEDFTVYKPRGAYASDPRLASYFRATKWLGRHIMPIIPGALDTEPEASIRLRQAHLLGKMLQDPELAGLWRKLEGELSFLITYPDSITPLQFAAATAGIPGPCDGAWVAAVRREFASAKYPDSAVVPIPQAHPGDAPAKYVQFLGERYTPDAQIHQEATSPHIAERVLPRALDIGYALFGSERCREHLAPEFEAYPGLADQLDILQKRFGGWGAGKTPGSVYAGWVGAIREVISPPSSPKLPPFLATEAWKDKSLTTALASWTQMRHDFVLYAKEPVTPAAAGIEWFVEPVPEAYERLSVLADGLDKRGFQGMADFGKLCKALKIASEAELAGADLRADETMSKAFQGIPGDEEWHFYIGAFGQWLLENFSPVVAEEHPCLVVDVAADSNPPNRVLHEATGPFQLVVIPGRKRDYLYGWVLSHYEFSEDNFTRLTDSDWEKRVDKGRHRELRPEWTNSYVYPG